MTDEQIDQVVEKLRYWKTLFLIPVWEGELRMQRIREAIKEVSETA